MHEASLFLDAVETAYKVDSVLASRMQRSLLDCQDPEIQGSGFARQANVHSIDSRSLEGV
jgi:hypothetical protein